MNTINKFKLIAGKKQKAPDGFDEIAINRSFIYSSSDAFFGGPTFLRSNRWYAFFVLFVLLEH